MSIFNTEEYLHEAIESVIHQTLSFEDHIQLILVNDGSTDKSEVICRYYQRRYPNNIVYVKKQNGGLSSGKNCGLKYVAGKYVNFLDSDDKWTNDAFEHVLRFIQVNNNPDVIGCRVKWFEGATGFHPLDYKFKTSRIIDLRKEVDCVQLQSCSSFVKAASIGNLTFSEDLKLAEDIRFLNTIILKTFKVGVVKEAIYLYRKRYRGDSLVQLNRETVEWYGKTLEHCHLYLVNISASESGTVPAFIQYVIMYDLQWRIPQTTFSILSEEEIRHYQDLFRTLIHYIDDDIIFRQRFLSMRNKLSCIYQKYGSSNLGLFTLRNESIYFKQFLIISPKLVSSLIEWTFLDINNGFLVMEGIDLCWLPNVIYNYTITIGDKVYFGIPSKYPKFNHKTVFGDQADGQIIKFRLALPTVIDDNLLVRWHIHFGLNSLHIRSSLGKFSHIPASKNGYFAKEQWLVSFLPSNIIVRPYTKRAHFLSEVTYLIELLYKLRLRVVMYRVLYWFFIPHIRNIWLLADRVDHADDNAMHLFLHLMNNSNPFYHPYFCIDKHSIFFAKLKKTGHVINIRSMKFKIYFLLADKIISSQADEFFLNPFLQDRVYMRDLYQFDFVYLQHGLIKDDISDWLHKFSKNIALFISASPVEYRSLQSPAYGYDKSTIQLLGFPRHDTLVNMKTPMPTREIIILPTWRSSFQKGLPNVRDSTVYIPRLKQTDYYKFFSSLIEDKELIAAMKRYSYRGVFGLHPKLFLNSGDFRSNNVIHVLHSIPNYQQLLSRAALLVTDYSSIAFDFAYLRKPIIYCQFDVQTFYEQHSYKPGYYNYEKNGFGPVFYDLRSTVKGIIQYMEHDCVLESKFLDRINTFYPGQINDSSAKIAKTISMYPKIERASLPQIYVLLIVSPLLFPIYLTHKKCRHTLNVYRLKNTKRS